MVLLGDVMASCLTWYVSIWWCYFAAVRWTVLFLPSPMSMKTFGGVGVHYWEYYIVSWVEAIRLSIFAKVNTVSVSDGCFLPVLIESSLHGILVTLHVRAYGFN